MFKGFYMRKIFNSCQIRSYVKCSIVGQIFVSKIQYQFFTSGGIAGQHIDRQSVGVLDTTVQIQIVLFPAIHINSLTCDYSKQVVFQCPVM